MIELTVVGSHNTDNAQEFTFRLDLGRRIPSVGTLRRSIKNGLWVLQRESMLKDQYSQADLDERARLSASPVLKNGDQVLVEGQVYQLRVVGNYSDCAILKPVEVSA